MQIELFALREVPPVATPHALAKPSSGRKMEPAEALPVVAHAPPVESVVGPRRLRHMTRETIAAAEAEGEEIITVTVAGPRSAPVATVKAKRADDYEEPADIAREILGCLDGATAEVEALQGLLADEPKPRALLISAVVDGAACLVCDDVPVPLEALLDRVRRTDLVGYALLADAAREIAQGIPLPTSGLGGTLGDTFTALLTRTNRRADLELQELKQMNADILGCSVEEAEARQAADRAKEAEEKAARKAQRQGPARVEADDVPTVDSEEPAQAAEENRRAAIQSAAMQRERQYLDDCMELVREQAQHERNERHILPTNAPAPKRAARGSKASRTVTPAAPADVTAQSMRRLAPRQVELLAKVRVEFNRAIYGSGYEATIPDWKNLKETMIALGGQWSKENKSKGIPPGFTFPDGTDVEETVRLAQTTGEVLDPRLAGFFPTPIAIAQDLAARLGIKPGWRVLEPSAGTGRLAVAARDLGAVVECVEPLPKNRDALTALGFALVGTDIMALDPEAHDGPDYDAVIANPPFDYEVEHVTRMGRFLDAGAPVASIMSGGVQFRDTREAVQFRSFLAAHDGTIEPMPDGSFLESGTGVRTVIVQFKACAECRSRKCASR
jgi:predicted RNA methylase